ncbi:MAG: DNA polymerase III subunit delta [Armatimonadetes bacterium]|jgi:DNA polymerase-3 subunit delta|nr:DNA polymerase III subunit delta [Armatimonadota bacterium]GBC90140.1 hypothetical protein HRbin14_00872 [bacterium HR14]GIV13339.1 MAG: DNA polymerase III subunit delta [Fimbriimonadales bacterium]CUU06372.1 DNA polymerase III, delta subunit [Armatimonadetes bacterium GBS]CUU36637.1 DNA polymerase III, delta subunit [Armatimonadetes bacterium DC]
MEIPYLQLRDEALRAPASVYLLTGEEPVYHRAFVERLRHALDIPHGSPDESVLDARETPPAQIALQAQTIPMESEKRLIIVHAVNRYTANDLKQLTDLVPRVPPFTVLVLLPLVGAEESEASKAGWKALTDAVKAHGVVVVCKPLRGRDLAKQLIDFAREQGKELGNAEADLLLTLVDGVAETAFHELEKVCFYVGARPTITAHDIQTVVSPSQQAQVFALVDAIVEGNASGALRQMKLLFTTGTPATETALKTLALIARHYRLLWGVKILLEHRQSLKEPKKVPPEITAMLVQEPNVLNVLERQPYLANKFRDQALRLSWRQLRSASEALKDADMALKGLLPGVNPAEIMERLIIKLTTGVGTTLQATR